MIENQMTESNRELLTDKYQELRTALSAKPTGGVWWAKECRNQADADGSTVAFFVRGFIFSDADHLSDEKIDMQYIAAAQPLIITKLLSERDTLRAALLEIAAITTLEDGGFSDDAAAEIQGIVRRALV